jgi:Rieske Fe-S protein
MNRREFVRSVVISSVLVSTGIVGIAQMAGLIQKNQANQQATSVGSVQTQNSQSQTAASAQQSSTVQQQTTAPSTTSSGAPAGYVYITQLSSLTGQASAYFTHPTYGSSMFVSVNSQWRAFGAVCTHRVCTLRLQSSEIFCPCHGATFSTNNGAVLGGPAPRAIAEYSVQIIGNNVYVSSSRIN